MDTIILKDRITSNFTDEEFFQFCADNRDLKIERNNKLEVIIMSPTGGLSGRAHAEIMRQLSNWNFEHQTGEVFDSSTGFCLSDRSVLAPDAAWVSLSAWQSLTKNEQAAFPPVCPEFVIEVRSKSDSLYELQEKMKDWLDNGAKLAWLVDPMDKTVIIYRQHGEMEIIKKFDQKIKGEGPVEGFILDLSLLKF